MDKCPMCGAKLTSGLTYCEACGADVDAYQKVYQSVMAFYTQPQQGPVYQPQTSPQQYPTQPQGSQGIPPQGMVQCPNCYAYNPQGYKFCMRCGKELNKSSPW